MPAENFDLGSELLELNSLNSLNSFNSSTSTETKGSIRWPKPDPAIFHGLAGDMVRAILPHTEADAVAIHSQFMVAFGNIVGRNAYLEIEADRHYPNLNIALTGETAKGRKGTSWGHAIRLLKSLEPEWCEKKITSGLSSGEGILYAVRDQEGGNTGIADKRLLIMEPELASVLRVIGRDGNTLSAIIRQAWDNGTMRTMTKNTPMKTTDAHISIIGHITKDELLRYLTSTESGNGFANRFLWLCVKRSKCLARGGNIQSVDFAPFLEALRESIDFAQNAGKIEPTEEAWCIWEDVYPELSEGMSGLLGAVTSRAEAQVMRLAMIYALLDRSYNIEPPHLLAALSLWDYSFASAQYIFGNNSGDPVADKILEALSNTPKGLTRTEISNLFNKNKQSGVITEALSVLQGQGFITNIKTKNPAGGRSVELWSVKKEGETV